MTPPERMRVRKRERESERERQGHFLSFIILINWSPWIILGSTVKRDYFLRTISINVTGIRYACVFIFS